MSGFDVELMTNLARDAVRNVRHELAISLSKVGAEMCSGSEAEQVDALVAILRADPSYRVRHAVTLVDSAAAS
jgi:HEAT repeat protein